MLRNIAGLHGYSIGATNSELGKVHDFYFDDGYWVIRYIVVDTGKWLRGRCVLVSPVAAEHADWEAKTIHVNLTMEQVRESPPVNTDKPISRQVESEVSGYFGWPLYCNPQDDPQPNPAQVERRAIASISTDSNLRSTREVNGYRIEALDGSIGHVEDFVIEDMGWGIRYLVIDTRNWLPGGRKVLVPPPWIERVSWTEMKVHVDVSREAVKQSPEFDASFSVNREYETRLYDYYGRPKYWV